MAIMPDILAEAFDRIQSDVDSAFDAFLPIPDDARARLVDAADNPDLIAQLQPDGYRAHPERAVVITVEALDWNCPQHIPQRLTLTELEQHLGPVRDEMARLQQENAGLKMLLASSS